MISVLVPVFNTVSYLTDFFADIDGQTFKDYEIIILDDGSTDGSAFVCDDFARTHANVRVYHEPHRGIAVARKRLIAEALGEWIIFADSDDRLEPNYLKRLYYLAAETGADVALCNYDRCYRNRVVQGGPVALAPGYYEGYELEAIKLDGLIASLDEKKVDNNPTIWNLLARKNLFDEAKVSLRDGIAQGEDAVLSYGVMLRAQSIAVTDEILYHYMQRPGSIMTTKVMKDESQQRELESALISAVTSAGYECLIGQVQLVIQKIHYLAKQEKTPFLSIVVLCCDEEEYLPRCLRSIANQTFGNFEVIVVDDASKDGGGHIADAWAKRDPRFRVIHNEIRGDIVNARKVGIRAARGIYIGSVDGDDWIEPDMYEKFCTAAIETSADMVQCSMSLDNENGSQTIPMPHETGLYNGKVYQREFQRKNGVVSRISHIVLNSLCPKIIKRELLINAFCGMPDECVLGEDAAASILAATQAKSIYVIRECLYHYRRRSEGSRTTSVEEDMPERLLKLAAFVQEKLSTQEENNYLQNCNAALREFHERVLDLMLMAVLQDVLFGTGITTKRYYYYVKIFKSDSFRQIVTMRPQCVKNAIPKEVAYIFMRLKKVPPIWVFRWYFTQSRRTRERYLKAVSCKEE
jgi:glycosyltransferase involved in cell wall biosynthesis